MLQWIHGVQASVRRYQLISRLGLEKTIWPITTLGLSCPLLLSGGLLSGRGHLASLNVFPVDGLGRSQTVQAIMTSVPAGGSDSEMF